MTDFIFTDIYADHIRAVNRDERKTKESSPLMKDCARTRFVATQECLNFS